MRGSVPSTLSEHRWPPVHGPQKTVTGGICLPLTGFVRCPCEGQAGLAIPISGMLGDEVPDDRKTVLLPGAVLPVMMNTLSDIHFRDAFHDESSTVFITIIARATV